MTILGISVGTSRTGVCILKDGVLLDREVHSYLRAWSDAKLRIIVNRYRQYVKKHGVTAIMVKIPPLRKHTKPITRLLKSIESLAREHDCLLDLITKKELKHRTGAHSTGELIDYARRLYPELSPLFEKGVPTEYMYYKKLFEAVLAAHVFSDMQRERAARMGTTTE
jgi:RNase H-fold protein (predicted Holliday junction resolvase)